MAMEKNKIEKTNYYIIIVDLFSDLLKAFFNAYLSFMTLPATLNIMAWRNS